MTGAAVAATPASAWLPRRLTGSQRVAIEVKSERLDFALYHMFKLSNLYRGTPLRAAFLVYAAETICPTCSGREFSDGAAP